MEYSEKTMKVWNIGYILAGTFFVAFFWGYNWMVTEGTFREAIASEPLWFVFSILPAVYGLLGLIQGYHRTDR